MSINVKGCVQCASDQYPSLAEPDSRSIRLAATSNASAITGLPSLMPIPSELDQGVDFSDIEEK
jgi:hypothetical protein